METKQKKVNIPQKGAWRKLAKRLKDLGERQPPQDLVDKINGVKEEKKKIAGSPQRPERDAEL
jgi:hypothetical protein